LVAGKIQGLEAYRVERPKNESVVQPGEFPITDKLLNAFKEFALTDKENRLTTELISKELDYIKVRLRQEIVTANYSSEAGAQVFLEIDPQVLKAIEVLPEAKKLAEKTGALINVG
jgi:carboxyl-terminal processing protease